MDDAMTVLNFHLEKNWDLGWVFFGGSGNMCIESGSWKDTVLSNGNVQSTFIALCEKASFAELGKLSFLFDRANEITRDELKRDRLIVQISKYHTHESGITLNSDQYTARVVSASWVPIDDPVLNRFNQRGQLIAVTFERVPRLERGDQFTTGNVDPGMIGSQAHKIPRVVGTNSGWLRRAIIDMRYNPATNGFPIKCDVKQLWMGIWEPRGTGYTELPGGLSPRIDMTSGFKAYPASGHAPEENGSTGLTIKYYTDGPGHLLNHVSRRDRFSCPLVGWNTTTSLGANYRREYIGKYRLLMRYKSLQPEDDLRNAKAQTLLNVFSQWTTEGKKHHVGPVKSFWHKDNNYHWLDLGEINVGGDDWSYVHEDTSGPGSTVAIDPGSWQFGIEAKGIGISTALDDQLKKLYGFFVERFVIIPANNYVYLNVAGALGDRDTADDDANPYISILTDDFGNLTAYYQPGPESTSGITKIPHIESRGWKMPGNDNAHLWLVVDHNNTYPTSYVYRPPVYLTGQPLSRFEAGDSVTD